jgi:hypothetical protein
MKTQSLRTTKPFLSMSGAAWTMPHRRVCALALLLCLLAGCAEDNWHAWHQNLETTQYVDTFHNPLISPGAQFAALPPAVQNSIRAETGGSDIAHVDKTTNSAGPVYVIYFQEHQLYPPLYVQPDGAVLDPYLEVAVGAPQETVGMLTGGPVTGVTLSDLPKRVVKTIQQRAPSSEIDFITKETHGDQVTYIVNFKNRTQPVLYLDQEGTVLKETPR